jgi:fatty acid desaturase
MHAVRLSPFPRSAYVRELRAALPREAFEPATSRLVLIPANLAVIVFATIAIASSWIPWFLVPLVSLVIGTSFASLTFVAHEALHGGIVRGRSSRSLVAWIGFLPFILSPRLWAAWHDRVHHATANVEGDPDMYPTLATYRSSRKVRFVINTFSLGGRRWRGGLSLLLGFTVQSAYQLIDWRQYLTPRALVIALAQMLASATVWVTVAGVVGFVPFLFVFVLPLLVANVIVMAFILTNHSLSPRVEIDDPLLSSLSVTLPRWLELLTLQFGYHVEHHLFPAMSSRHARKVRGLLREHWPGRYQSMPLRSALARLHETSRVYLDAVTLVDPHTGEQFPTLIPSEPACSPSQATSEPVHAVAA